MPSINQLPHPPTLAFYRTALRSTRSPALAPQLAHLQRKLRYNIRDGISIYRDEHDPFIIQSLIEDGEKDLAILRAWKDVDVAWLERIFKKPTAKKGSLTQKNQM
ncbi:hypothetical protein BGZ94_008488 [Podila epigama]|nr:hypothetical protein BGZ94_008488 [Podila epigama]